MWQTAFTQQNICCRLSSTGTKLMNMYISMDIIQYTCPYCISLLCLAKREFYNFISFDRTVFVRNTYKLVPITLKTAITIQFGDRLLSDPITKLTPIANTRVFFLPWVSEKYPQGYDIISTPGNIYLTIPQNIKL